MYAVYVAGVGSGTHENKKLNATVFSGFPRQLLPRSVAGRVLLVVSLALICFARISLSVRGEREWARVVLSDVSPVRVQMFVRMGVPPDTLITDDLSPLQFAVQNRHIDLVRKLVALGADPDFSPSDERPSPYVMAQGDEELIGALLSSDTYLLKHCDEKNFNSLMYAAAANDARMVRVLIASGVAIGTSCDVFWDAFTIAIAAGANEVVRELARHGPDYVRSLGGTQRPLDVARLTRNAEAIELLEAPTRAAVNELKAKRLRDKSGPVSDNRFNQAIYQQYIGKPLPLLIVD